MSATNPQIAEIRRDAYLDLVASFESGLQMLSEDTVFSVDSLQDTSSLTVLELMKKVANQITTEYGLQQK